MSDSGHEEEQVSAIQLLQRSPSREYMDQWVCMLRDRAVAPEQGKQLTLLVFRLEEESLAISLEICKSITDPRPLHTVPHKKNPILRGLINIDGQIRICFRLENLLEIDQCPQLGSEKKQNERYVVIQKDGFTWVFAVDEIYGIVRCDKKEIENVPVNILKSSANFLRGVLNWENKHVGILDDELVLESLKRSL